MCRENAAKKMEPVKVEENPFEEKVAEVPEVAPEPAPVPVEPAQEEDDLSDDSDL